VPAVTRTASTRGVEVWPGSSTSVITASETNQITASKTRLSRVVVWGVGTTWVIDVYDHASANTNPVWQWVSADGKGTFQVEIPLQLGLRVVTSGGAAGSVTLVWA